MRGGELEHHNTRFGFRYFELLARIVDFERTGVRMRLSLIYHQISDRITVR